MMRWWAVLGLFVPAMACSRANPAFGDDAGSTGADGGPGGGNDSRPDDGATDGLTSGPDDADTVDPDGNDDTPLPLCPDAEYCVELVDSDVWDGPVVLKDMASASGPGGDPCPDANYNVFEGRWPYGNILTAPVDCCNCAPQAICSPPVLTEYAEAGCDGTVTGNVIGGDCFTSGDLDGDLHYAFDSAPMGGTSCSGGPFIGDLPAPFSPANASICSGAGSGGACGSGGLVLPRSRNRGLAVRVGHGKARL